MLSFNASAIIVTTCCSQIVKYLFEHRAALGTLAFAPVSTLLRPTASTSIISVGIAATVGDALRALVSNKITGLPVLDDTGRIIANVSVSDVRGLAHALSKPEEIEKILSTNIIEFLADSRGKAGRAAPPSLTPAVLRPGDSFGAAVELLATSSLHRLYVVDSDNMPVGVITLTDIVKTVASTLQL